MKNLTLTEQQIEVLQEALLCAEIQRELSEQGTGKKFEELYDIIDNQVFEQNEYGKIVLNKVKNLFL
jgi:hypothetical protein